MPGIPDPVFANLPHILNLSTSDYNLSASTYINDAVSRNWFFSRLLESDLEDMLSETVWIQEDLNLDYPNTATVIAPDSQLDYIDAQNTVRSQQGLARVHNYTVIRRDEQLLTTEAYQSKHAMGEQIKNAIVKRRMNTDSGLLEKIESLVTGVPNFDLMESVANGGTRFPMSIFALIVEPASGLPIDADGDTWTSVQGVSPTTYSKWKNQKKTYSKSAPNTDPGGILSAFRNMHTVLMQKDAPRELSNVMADPVRDSDLFIACSEDGVTDFEEARIAIGDKILMNDSPIQTFKGIPLIGYQSFGTAAVYDDGSSGLAVENSGATNLGSRYYWINKRHLSFKIYRHDAFRRHEAKKPFNQLDRVVEDVTVTLNTWLTSRKRHGIVSPA